MNSCLPGGRDSWRLRERHVYTVIFKMDNQKNLLYSKWNSAQCHVPAWMGSGFGGEWIHIYVLLLWTSESMYFFELLSLLSSDTYSEVWITWWFCFCFFLLEAPCSSILTVPIYILTSHVGEFSFLHVFTSICYLWTFLKGIFTLFIYFWHQKHFVLGYSQLTMLW